MNKNHNSNSSTSIRSLMPQSFGRAGIIWVTVLSLICIIGLYAYYKQLKYGLEVTAMRDYTSWGLYITNFVFFVAISLVGSLISAILKLSNVKWRIPLTRLAEIIAVSAIIFAAISIIVDMGRPDRMFNLFLHGRIQSPIIWDVIVIITYLVISVLLLFIPMIPDLATCRTRSIDVPDWIKKGYQIMSLNWQATNKQFQVIKKSTGILSILIIPVALAIHTVTSWLFATTLRPGWDSTNFGAYFVSGAFVVGAAAVIVFMYIVRKQYQLKNLITDNHFNYMGKLLVMLSLLYFYFTINEYFTPAFKMKQHDIHHFHELFSGTYAPIFWSTIILGMILPTLLMLFKTGRKPLPIFIISIVIVIGAWFKRYLIVIPTLLSTYIPIQRVSPSWKVYIPTWEEWAITSATLAGALLLITFFVRFFPIIPIWELPKDKIDYMNTETP